MQRLSNLTLASAAPGVQCPAYARAVVQPGIVHLGIGAFHRAHQAVCIDDCLAAGELGWGIRAASLRRTDTRDRLAPQDGLYTMATRSDDAQALRVIGSIADVIVAPENPAALLVALTDPRIRIVTLTITEKGYGVDLGTRTLRTADADVTHDMAHPGQPRTAMGFLLEAVARRRAAGSLPLTILSCDNQPTNGRTVRLALQLLADAQGRDLQRHLAEDLACPSCMVDRIVPATTPDDLAQVAAALGLHDAWPVLAEPFMQWVIEDRFASGRPKLERCGVQFVADVGPHERMKLRLLNGAHTALAATGLLAGHRTVAEAMAEPAIGRFARRLWSESMASLELPAAEMRAYTERLALRFANRALRHRLEQIASDGSQKVPQRLLQPLRELARTGRPHASLVFAVAAWMLACDGVSENGAPFVVDDKVFHARFTADRRGLPAAALADAFLACDEIFGEDAANGLPALREGLVAALEQIRTQGVLGALERLTASA